MALALTCIAAMGTSLGGLLVVLFRKLNFTQLGFLAGLAGGLMLSMVFFDLVPESLESLGFSHSNAYFFLGAAFFAVVLRFVPEESFEQFVMGDSQADSDSEEPSPRATHAVSRRHDDKHRKILLSGLFTALGISLHNFPEGLAVFLAAKKSKTLGFTLTVAMTLHNIPEGVAVALPIYFATKSKWKALQIATFSGLAEPAAVIVAAMFFPSSVSQYAVDAMLSGVAGIMAFLVFYELVPLALKHAGLENSVASIFIGMAMMSASLAFMNNVN